MEDTLTCPTCNNKLRTVKTPNRHFGWINKTSSYIERVCSKGMNHILRIFVDEETAQVDLLRTSLDPKYSQFLEIDFVNQKCRINCMKEGKSEYIEISKMMEPDFPDLIKLKERVSVYVTFS